MNQNYFTSFENTKYHLPIPGALDRAESAEEDVASLSQRGESAYVERSDHPSGHYATAGPRLGLRSARFDRSDFRSLCLNSSLGFNFLLVQKYEFQ